MTNPVLRVNHLLLSEVVRPGDAVVDATAGNGNDTLLLARLVAPTGIVYALDIQPEALTATRELIHQHHLDGIVKLQLTDHLHMADVVESPLRAVVFNLGYLPGGDKRIITQAEKTVQALSVAADMLAPGGVLSVVTYSGHAGGDEEEAAVAQWFRSLDKTWLAVSTGMENRGGNPPRLWFANKGC